MSCASVSLRSVVKHFAVLPDPRHHRNRRHLLVDVITIAVCGVIVGCDGPTAIAIWAKAKQDWLKELQLLDERLMLFSNRLVAMGSTPFINGVQRPAESLSRSLSLHNPVSLARPCPVVSETQQIECPVAFKRTLPSSGDPLVRPTKLDEPSFRRMER